MDGNLEKIRKHSGLPSIEDENQYVSEEVEEQDEEKLLEVTKEYENSQPTQKLESVIERYEEEMKKFWKEQQTSSIEVLFKQMLSAKEEVEEQDEEVPVPNGISIEEEVVEVFQSVTPNPQRLLEVTEEHEDSLPKDSMENHEEEREEDNQGSSHSSEAESCIEEELIELSMQEAYDEENTLTITQHPSLDI
ncbi:hypothetical protein AHAS_Ahas18G0156200 [Arachis hypogaea]